MNPLETIKTSLITVGNLYQSADPLDRKKAQGCVKQLSSKERKSLDKMMKIALNPSSKLRHTKNTPLEPLSDRLIALIYTNDAKDKDHNLKNFQKIILGIWRGIKNSLGYRINSIDLQNSINQFSSYALTENKTKALSQAKEEVFNRYFKSNDTVKFSEIEEIETAYLDTPLYRDEIFDYTNEYEILKLTPGAPLSEIETAYINHYTLNGIPIEITAAFQKLYLFKEIERSLLPNPFETATLETAFATCKQYESLQDEAKKQDLALKLYALCQEHYKIVEAGGHLSIKPILKGKVSKSVL